MDKILSDLVLRKVIEEKRREKQYERPSLYLELDNIVYEDKNNSKKKEEPKRVIIIDL